MEPLKAADEFKTLYFNCFGIQLSDEEALEQAGRLLRLYRAVHAPSGSDAIEKSREEAL